MRWLCRRLLHVGAVAVLIGSGIGSSRSAEAGVVVVDFDDLKGFGSVPDGYGGINWGGQWTYYDSDQDPFNPASGLTRVFPGAPSPDDPYDWIYFNEASFSFLENVVFQGAAFAGYPYDVSFQLYLNGNLVHTSTAIQPSEDPSFLASGYSGLVDKVVVFTTAPSGEVYYVMDDVKYETLSSVPEPTSVVMLGVGGLMLALGGVRRRLVRIASERS
jgi:hypothetical protein